MQLRFVLLTAIFLTMGNAAHAQTETFFSVPVADAPELAPRGPYSVGVRTIELKIPDQVDILNFDKNTGKAPVYERPLKIEVWYLATIPAGAEERTVYEMGFPRGGRGIEGVPKTVAVLGKALRDAPPVKGRQYPLVIVSHGYPGSRYFLSYLSETPANAFLVTWPFSRLIGQLARAAAEKRVIGNFGQSQCLPFPTPGELGPTLWKS
jgi:hypothetical protein